MNVVDLFTLVSRRDHPHGLEDRDFIELFTENKPIVFGFHGYPRVIHELVHHRPNPSRFHVHGYMEEGSTTTPFDMRVINQLDRYHLCINALGRIDRLKEEASVAVERFEKKLTAHAEYVREHGVDLPEVQDWRWGEF